MASLAPPCLRLLRLPRPSPSSYSPSPSLSASHRPLCASPARRSRIGAAPIKVPPTIALHPRPRPSAPAHPAPHTPTTDLDLRGPRGLRSLPIPACIQLDLLSLNPSSSSSSSDSPSPSSRSASSPSDSAGAGEGDGWRTLSLSVVDRHDPVQRALWGTTRSHLASAIDGLTTGFTTDIRLHGVGYRASIDASPSSSSSTSSSSQSVLVLKLGFAHPVLEPVPPGIAVEIPTPTRIVLRGTDKHALGAYAARIRAWRKPEPYNGKGIFVNGETIKRKEVKKK